MDEYLFTCKQRLEELDRYGKVHAVIGNEACDLDSAVCALVYAYFSHSMSNDKTVVHLPILNIPREDYNLRTEITYFFRKNGIQDENLIFMKDVDLFQLHRDGHLALTLVDFNVLPSNISPLEGAISQIIDHHKRECAENPSVDISVEPVGSCCTLVAEKLLNERGFHIAQLEALLLYGTILLDTVCVSEAAGRTTDKDISVISRLEQILEPSPENQRQTMFHALQAAKTDVSGLTSVELLRRDMKMVISSGMTVAISSIPLHIQDFLQAKQMHIDLVDFSRSCEAEVLVIMAMVILADDQPLRQLAVYSASRIYREQIVDVLLQSTDPNLLLQPITSHLADVSVFNQDNVKASRKKVLPIIKSFLTGGATPTDTTFAPLPGGLPIPTISLEGAALERHLLSPEDDEKKPVVIKSSESNKSVGATEKKYSGIDRHSIMSQLHKQTLGGAISKAESENVSSDLSMEMFDPLASDSPISKPSTPDQNSSNVTPELQKSCPSTPPNSMLETSVLGNALMNSKQHNLPSFNSLEMVQKIKQKKAELDVISEAYTQDEKGENDSSDIGPFTPSNSFADSHLSNMQSHLPSFNTSEMVARVSEKRSAFTEVESSEEVQDADRFPFTPPNSYVDTSLDKFRGQALQIDQEDLLNKVLTKKRHRNHSDNIIYPRMINCEQLPEDMTGNAVAYRITQDMMLDRDFGTDNSNDIPENKGASSSGKVVAEEEEVAKCIVEEIMQSALDTCDPAELEQVLKSRNSLSEELPSTTNSQENESAEKCLKFSQQDSQYVETEYLSEVDPLQGNIDIIKNQTLRQFSTDAEREVAESASFNMIEEERRKMSISENADEEFSASAADKVNLNAIDGQDDNMGSKRVVGRRGKAPPLGQAVNFWVAASVDKGGTDQHCGSGEGSSEPSMIPEPSHEPHMSQLGGGDADCGSLSSGAASDSDHSSASNCSSSSSSTSSSNSTHSCTTATSGDSYVVADADSADSNDLSKEQQQAVCSKEASFLIRIDEKEEVELESPPPPPDMSYNHTIIDRDSERITNSLLYEQADLIVNKVFSSIKLEDLDSADISKRLDNASIASDNEVNGVCQRTVNFSKQSVVIREVPTDSGERICENGHGCAVINPAAETAESYDRDHKRDKNIISSNDRGINGAPGRRARDSHVVFADQRDCLIKDNDPSFLDNSLPEDLAMETGLSPLTSEDEEMPVKRVERPQTLIENPDARKKIVPNKDLLKEDETFLSQSSLGSIGSASMSEEEIMASIENVKTPDDLSTPDALNNSVFDGELTWGNETPSSPEELIPEYTASDELHDERNWRSVTIAEKQFRIDMKVIEPYKKVLSHGGYYGDGLNAIVVFCACYLPDRSRRDYHYVMDNLFLYVISTLELLVVEDYMIVYFHGATPKHKMPSLRWLKRCYEMIDRRLRKNLKKLLIVHPTFWLRTIVLMTKPFVSSKFSNKLHYVRSLQDMGNLIPTEYIYIPDEIKAYDARKNKTTPSPVTPP